MGGVFVAYLGVRTLREARTVQLMGGVSARADPGSVTRALREGTAANFLSPHPWITWVTVLAPLTLVSWRDSPVNAVALVIGFYATLVGAKVVISLLVTAGRDRLTKTGYRQTMTVAGVLLLLAAAGMWYEFGGTALSALSKPLLS